ncbi:LamG-like jellyroll fold domain-containing protein [Caldimonas sp. KR1-144]|uniref:LamG-like jellyroll fold domain-containing protein n=1 Tax=Caldimonas sp. KR1-144 TaxID=3400911 RepID=UPI003BFCEBAA
MISSSTDIHGALRARQRGYLLNPFRFGAPPAGDPHYASVKILLHGNAANGSTVAQSSDPAAQVGTSDNGCAVSTAQAKWGSGSWLFSAPSNHRLRFPSTNLHVGSSDFVIEGWIYPTALPAAQATIISNYGSSGVRGIDVRLDSTGKIASRWSLNGSTDAAAISSAASVTLNAWQHFVVRRSGSSMRVYLAGTGGTDNTSIGASAINGPVTEAWIGGTPDTGGGTWFLGAYLDDLRITVGTDRGYTGAAISVPTAQFPDA